MMITRICYLALFTFLLINSSAGFAAQEPSTDNAIASSSIAAPTENSAPDIGALGPSASSAPKKMVEHTYTQMTYDNLYRLAWSLDAYSLSNVEDLTVFLKITECNLYTKFFQNEFEWEKIKIATREYLKNNKDKVPRYYEYVQPITMGRYDYSLQGFPIVDAARNFKAQKNLQFANFDSGETPCGHYNFKSKQYPSSAVLSLVSPLNLSFIRVPLPLAQKYIEWRNRQGMFNEDNRQAYIRYRIRIDGYEGNKSYKSSDDSFNFRGKLLRLDVFADTDMLLPLYNQVF